MEKLVPIGKKFVTTIEEFTKTKSGLVIPGNTVPEYMYGKVIAKGGEVKLVKVGDRIIFSPRVGATVKFDGIMYKILEIENVIAKVEETAEQLIVAKEKADGEA